MQHLQNSFYDFIFQVQLDGIRYAHPIMIHTDILRIYNDLVRSGFLLKKQYVREVSPTSPSSTLKKR